jgi:hypothetical protein
LLKKAIENITAEKAYRDRRANQKELRGKERLLIFSLNHSVTTSVNSVSYLSTVKYIKFILIEGVGWPIEGLSCPR